MQCEGCFVCNVMVVLMQCEGCFVCNVRVVLYAM